MPSFLLLDQDCVVTQQSPCFSRKPGARAGPNARPTATHRGTDGIAETARADKASAARAVVAATRRRAQVRRPIVRARDDVVLDAAACGAGLSRRALSLAVRRCEYGCAVSASWLRAPKVHR